MNERTEFYFIQSLEKHNAIFHKDAIIELSIRSTHVWYFIGNVLFIFYTRWNYTHVCIDNMRFICIDNGIFVFIGMPTA